MSLTPVVAVHLTAALGALVIGPVVLWARRGRTQRPRLHRAFGYAWVTLIVAAAVSALFIRDTQLPNVAGFTPIHLLVPPTLAGLVVAFRALARGDIAVHRRVMQRIYLGACVLAGAFTLLPNRLLGRILFDQWLGFDAAARARASFMAGQIVSHTPPFVWALLALLVALALGQVRQRRVGVARLAVLPLVAMVLSLLGTASLFGHAHLPLVLACWMVAAGTTFAWIARMAPPPGATFDAAERTLVLPGSWTPLALMVGVFALRYAANVALAIHPDLAADAPFAAALAVASGLVTGAFGGRAARLWKLIGGSLPAIPRLTA